eukprot:3548012-Amphidinium_carterae.1
MHEVLRNAHRRGVYADTPKEHQAGYHQLWLKQRACSYKEAVACLDQFPKHAGLVVRRAKTSQTALQFDARTRYIARSVPRLLECQDVDKIFKRLGWRANADHTLSSFGHTASWLVRAELPPPQASVVLELAG